MIMGSAGKDAKSASASAGLAAAAKLRGTDVKLAAAALGDVPRLRHRLCRWWPGHRQSHLATALIPIAANAAPQSAAMLLQASCMRQ